MSSCTKVVRGSDTLWVEEGHTADEDQFVWKEKLDKKSERPYYVNLKTKDKSWLLPGSKKGKSEKKEKSKKASDTESTTATDTALSNVTSTDAGSKNGKKTKEKKSEGDEGDDRKHGHHHHHKKEGKHSKEKSAALSGGLSLLSGSVDDASSPSGPIGFEGALEKPADKLSGQGTLASRSGAALLPPESPAADPLPPIHGVAQPVRSEREVSDAQSRYPPQPPSPASPPPTAEQERSSEQHQLSSPGVQQDFGKDEVDPQPMLLVQSVEERPPVTESRPPASAGPQMPLASVVQPQGNEQTPDELGNAGGNPELGAAPWSRALQEQMQMQDDHVAAPARPRSEPFNLHASSSAPTNEPLAASDDAPIAAAEAYPEAQPTLPPRQQSPEPVMPQELARPFVREMQPPEPIVPPHATPPPQQPMSSPPLRATPPPQPPPPVIQKPPLQPSSLHQQQEKVSSPEALPPTASIPQATTAPKSQRKQPSPPQAEIVPPMERMDRYTGLPAAKVSHLKEELSALKQRAREAAVTVPHEAKRRTPPPKPEDPHFQIMRDEPQRPQIEKSSAPTQQFIPPERARSARVAVSVSLSMPRGLRQADSAGSPTLVDLEQEFAEFCEAEERAASLPPPKPIVTHPATIEAIQVLAPEVGSPSRIPMDDLVQLRLENLVPRQSAATLALAASLHSSALRKGEVEGAMTKEEMRYVQNLRSMQSSLQRRIFEIRELVSSKDAMDGVCPMLRSLRNQLAVSRREAEKTREVVWEYFMMKLDEEGSNLPLSTIDAIWTL